LYQIIPPVKLPFIACIFLALLGCQSNRNTKAISQKIDTTTLAPKNSIRIKLVGTYADSTTVGKEGQNKVEIKEYGTDSAFVVINFFAKGKDSSWLNLSSFTFIQPTNVDMKIEDYNGDGFMDMSYKSATAARGANELRSIFIYEPATNKFIYLRNSSAFPNVNYNQELGCLEAMYFYGTTCNSFFKIQGDSLREFIDAPIEQEEGERFYREVYFTDNGGNRKMLERKRIAADMIFEAYNNYVLIKKYKNR
jgi:hypothetical protein